MTKKFLFTKVFEIIMEAYKRQDRPKTKRVELSDRNVDLIEEYAFKKGYLGDEDIERHVMLDEIEFMIFEHLGDGDVNEGIRQMIVMKDEIYLDH